MNASKKNLEQRTARVLITGRVQGVAYRAWAERTAMARGLSGWVRNRRDGVVEALFSGPRADVDDMLRRCCEGPPAARVHEVSVIEEGGTVPLGFAILSTA
jgi:acylphosphatase